MQRSTVFSIVTIACFCSILFIPIGIVLMIYYTQWKKPVKIGLASGLSVLYVLLAVLVLFAKPANNSKGVNIPFGAEAGYSANDSASYGSEGFSETGSSKKKSEASEKENEDSSKKSKKPSKEEKAKNHYGKGDKKDIGRNNSRWIYSILFFLFMVFLILWQNLKPKKNNEYENPYVDTNKYKLPLEDDAKLPLVHYLHLRLAQDETILFATETKQKDNEGNFVITNKRVVVANPQENMECPLAMVDGATSATNSVMVFISGDKKHYVFLPENQMKYALAVIRWAVKKYSGN